MRTQRVTFVALFRFLGLSEELTHESMHSAPPSNHDADCRSTAEATKQAYRIPPEITFESVQGGC